MYSKVISELESSILTTIALSQHQRLIWFPAASFTQVADSEDGC